MNSMSFEFSPRRREPALFVPGVVLAFVAILIAIQAGMSVIGDDQRGELYFGWGFVPGRFTYAIAPGWIADLIGRSSSDSQALAAARLLRDVGALSDGPHFHTLVTYAFLHGSWAHVGLNSIWLIAFGPPVARRFGALRFVLFFLVTALAGALAHWAFAPYDGYPMIGASAADSGLMAASARFIFRRGASPGPDVFVGGDRSQRLASLRDLMTDKRALIFFGIWLASNFVFGAGAGALGAADAPIAWVAHVGGFLAGLLLFGLFDRPLKLATR